MVGAPELPLEVRPVLQITCLESVTFISCDSGLGVDDGRPEVAHGYRRIRAGRKDS